MSFINKVKLTPKVVKEYDCVNTEHECGLKWAVVYDNGSTQSLIALFNAVFWAENFVKESGLTHFKVREVYDDSI